MPLLSQPVSQRYDRGSILVTSNGAVNEWGTGFGDTVVATGFSRQQENRKNGELCETWEEAPRVSA